ncbi:MAG: hypothetical protein FJ271_21845 [Planctomycetes bacterium]|nr:hypothetical protein [Planctomycetota bacterium]
MPEGDRSLAVLPADHPGRGSIEEIAKVGERAAALTNQMLAFSRKQILAPVVVNLNAFIADIEKMPGRLIREDIRLTRAFDPDLHPVKVDPGQIGQVLMNLVVNARDAMPDGGQISIKTANVELNEAAARDLSGIQPGVYAVLTVKDRGCGMDEAIRSHIFEHDRIRGVAAWLFEFFCPVCDGISVLAGSGAFFRAQRGVCRDSKIESLAIRVRQSC